MELTYHLRNTQLRNILDLTIFEDDIWLAQQSFPMIEIIDITKRDYTIYVNTNDTKKKNRVVRAFGHKLAKTGLGKIICETTNSEKMFIEKV